MTQTSTNKEDLEHKYKDTIDLPQTDFPMRASSATREPEFQAEWERKQVYKNSIDLRSKEGAETFILHDGPPYLSSDKIHIGTALNKILKDIVIRYKCQKGFKTPYVPGYDSHGLPIENAVVQSIKGGRQSVTIPELREKCKDFALANLKGQEEKFRRLGVLGQWEDPYVTLNPKFEAEEIKLFGEMAEKGFIYRGLKTVYWSYGAETALADAEVEYNEEHISQAIYVSFACVNLSEKSHLLRYARPSQSSLTAQSTPAAQDSQALHMEASRTDSGLLDNRPVSKHSFEETGRLKKVATAPLGASCPNDNSDFRNKSNVKMVVWTTTPWTIPGNMAIALGKDIDYVIVEASRKDSEDNLESIGKFIFAKDLLGQISKDANLELKELSEIFKGKELEGLVTKHPLFDRESPIIFGDHVTTDAGTGAVHTAPGHGQEDFQVGKEYGLEILCPVDGRGVYTSEALSYEYKNIENLINATKGNDALKAKLENRDLSKPIDLAGFQVIKHGNDLLISMLKDSGALLSRKKITHSYPYCWRSKTPLLYRATEQWFCSIDGFREKALSEIDKVTWIPERGRNRIYKMVESRGDWCISRQRTWGVPIPALYDSSKLNEQGNPEAILSQEIIEHVAKIFAEEGSSSWYVKEVSKLIPTDVIARSASDVAIQSLSDQEINERFKKETDTMDVWFDSGSTHRSVVQARKELCPDGIFKPVDLYLEGSDQHRGWFQSSLLTSVATNGIAPYKSVLTHGFVMDDKGRKMSKSLGNVVDPADVIKSFGADILRLWVASVDYSIDIKVGDSMFKQLSDIYRNFRNTSRYILGNLHDFDPTKNSIEYDKLWSLDKLLLHRLQLLTEKLTEDFDNYQFFKYYQTLQNFCANDLSAFYFDIIKDRLYTHGRDSLSRRSAQTVVYELLIAINRFFVPVLPHLAEDIYNFSPDAVKNSYLGSDFFMKGVEADKASILLSNWPSVNKTYVDEKLSKDWDSILKLRDETYKVIEVLRKDKVLGKSLEAFVEFKLPKQDFNLLKTIENEIKPVFIISDFSMIQTDTLEIKASKYDAEKCVRCWKFFKPVEIKEGICPVCTVAVSA